MLAESFSDNRHFYPRSPCGERLVVGDVMGKALAISIHALLAESDLIQAMARLMGRQFLSTLSLRRATRGAVYLLS